jgi:predicted RND superfamily exporter protein
MEKPTFFARRALLILVVVFFFVPFALRGARMAVQGMKNDVKDWLPKNFAETRDLDDFRKHFLSEQFVLVSWDGCTGAENDERFRVFVAKLSPETPPSLAKKQAEAAQAAKAQAASEQAAAGATGNADQATTSDPSAAVAASAGDNDSSTNDASRGQDGSIVNPTHYIHQGDDFIGDKLGLYHTGTWHENWGQLGEKWLRGRASTDDTRDEAWYYITRDGDLFRWNAVDAPLAALGRMIYRAVVSKKVEGTLVHSFGPIDGAWYHSDPRRLRAQLFKTVTTGPDVLASLTREGGELANDDEEAHRRLAGTLFGPPDEATGERTTCIMLTLTDAARRNLHLVLGRGMLGKPRGLLYEVAHESNIPDEELRMGGPPVDNVAIDEEGSITLVRLMGFSIALGLSLSLLCFRSISATIMIFFVGGISAVVSLACVWWLGHTVDAIMMSMPSMVYVLGLSGAAHIINYYHEAVHENGHRGAPERAIQKGWKPALLCNLTTAIGLITLVSSQLVPIRKFGLFSAIGVMLMLGVLLVYLPAALQIWPQNPRSKRANESDQPSWWDNLLLDFWGRLSGGIIRHHALVSAACVLVIAAFGFGLTRMNTSVNLLRMFHSEAKIIKDYEWLEANLGQLVPMEVVVRVPPMDQCPPTLVLRQLREELDAADTSLARKAEIEQQLAQAQFQMPFLERMEMAARVQKVIEEEFGPEGRDVVGRALSAATFVRPLPNPGGSTLARSLRSSTSSRLEAHRDEFLHSDYLRIDERDSTELWRISLRLGATKGVDYGSFVSNLQETVEPVLAAQRKRAAILRSLADEFDEQAGPARPLAGASVLLLGAPAGVFSAAKDATDENDVSAAPAPETVKANVAADDPTRHFAQIDQQRIFIRTLRDLLINSRLSVKTRLAEGQSPADFACVVVVGNPAGTSMDALRQTAGLVIDARDHQFAATKQATAYEQNPHSVAAVYTGVVPIVYKAQRMLLDSLIQSTFWSVIMITPLLMWIARSASAGIIAMIPNVLPIVMVFGGMGWFGIDVDVGSMMTASIALGVAVDDTIHYLNWFREALDRTGDRKQAIVEAYKHCATPTIQAATISGLGLSVFAISTFTPTQRFGVLMLVILWLGAIAELIFFPALLAGPLGAMFKPRKQTNQTSNPVPAAGPPQLVVVRDEDAADGDNLDIYALGEDSADGSAGEEDSGIAAAPHTGLVRPSHSLRRDASHRRRG